jgi:hypothetical protein
VRQARRAGCRYGAAELCVLLRRRNLAIIYGSTIKTGRRSPEATRPLVLRVGYIEAFAADGDDQSFGAKGL